MEKSMTEGRPLRLILKFAMPLLLGNLLQQTYNLIDAAIVGRILGAGALASVGATSSVQFLVLGFCIGSCTGFGIPVAKYFGAENYKEMRNCIFHAAVLGGVIALAMTLFCSLSCHSILRLMHTPEDIYAGSYSYLLVIFLGIPFTILYNLLAGILRAVGNSKAPFLFLAVSTVLNIFLDYFCIAVLKWSVAGAAIATVASQAVSGCLCLVYILKKMQILHLSRENLGLGMRRTGYLLATALPMGLQFSITAIGSMVMQASNNSLGSIYVTGFTAGTKIKQFMICPFDAIATGVSVFCSQNYGAGKADRIIKGFREGAVMATLYGLIASTVMILAGRPMSRLFLNSDVESVILDASSLYLRRMGYFFWLLGWLNVARVTTQGLGFSGRAMLSGVMEMTARTAVSLIFVKRYGFDAITFTDQCAWILAVVYLIPVSLLCIRKAVRRCRDGSSFA